MTVHHVEVDTEFPRMLEQAGMKLVVVDFFATWCGPCQQIAPIFEQLSQRYTQAVFVKVDVEKCQVAAQSQGVTAMPTFHYYINKNRVDTLRGASASELETKIKKWIETAAGSGAGSGEEAEVPGQMDLYGFISKKDSECLNESNSHQLNDCLNAGGASYLESDADEQLIINIPFNQPVKLHSLKIKGHADRGPKTVKIFINQPHTLDFDQATKMEPTQLLELSESQLNGEIINLRFVKFQNVQNVQFFVVDNQSDADTTRISMLKIFGSPINATNMGEFKRVAGKKGEGH
jgi:thioredoxin